MLTQRGEIGRRVGSLRRCARRHHALQHREIAFLRPSEMADGLTDGAVGAGHLCLQLRLGQRLASVRSTGGWPKGCGETSPPASRSSHCSVMRHASDDFRNVGTNLNAVGRATRPCPCPPQVGVGTATKCGLSQWDLQRAADDGDRRRRPDVDHLRPCPPMSPTTTNAPAHSLAGRAQHVAREPAAADPRRGGAGLTRAAVAVVAAHRGARTPGADDADRVAPSDSPDSCTLAGTEPGQPSAQAPSTQTSPSGQVPQEATPHFASRPPGPHASTAQVGVQHSPR